MAYQDFEAFRPDLLRLARSLLKGSRVRLEAEDLVQTVLTRILAANPTDVDSPRHFAFAALKNLFLDEVRRFSHQRELLATEGGIDAPDHRSEQGRDAVEVADLLSKLSPEERCFVGKVCFEDLPVPEAQKQCGWPARSPYYQLRLLLDRLAKLMSEGVEGSDAARR